MLDRCDIAPVFFAPFVSSVMRVEPQWIDYNGHLNMAYYHVLFDRAVDEIYALIGVGRTMRRRAASRFSQPKPMCAICANCMPAISFG